MAKPAITLEFVTGNTVDWPVKVKLPKSVGNTRGAAQGEHTTKTVKVTFQVLPDSEFDELMEELKTHNKTLAEARARLAEAADDTREAAQEAVDAASAAYRSWRVMVLRQVVVGLPAGHGFDAVFRDLPDFSPDLVEAIADYRMFGAAMETAYWEMMNGGKAGN